MPLWVWSLANGSVGLVLVLLIDPTRDLQPVFALLAVAVGTLLAWRFVRRYRVVGLVL
jgi:hypothetical protein